MFMHRSKVLLPEPLGPSKTVTSDGGMSRDTSLRIVTSFFVPALNRLWMLRSDRRGGASDAELEEGVFTAMGFDR